MGDDKRQRFIQRVWKQDPAARHEDSQKDEWDMLWISMAITNKALCNKAWDSMADERRVLSVLDAANVCLMPRIALRVSIWLCQCHHRIIIVILDISETKRGQSHWEECGVVFGFCAANLERGY